MAAGVQKFTTQGPSADTGERQALYDISIDQSQFNSTGSSDASGGVTPMTWRDLGKANNLDNAKRLARGSMRYRKKLQLLGTYSNFKISHTIGIISLCLVLIPLIFFFTLNCSGPSK